MLNRVGPRLRAGLMAFAIVLSNVIMPASQALALTGVESSASPIGATGSEDEKKITVCHRSDAAGNPYVAEEIAVSAAYNRYESEVNGNVVVYPDPGWGDIVPPFVYRGVTYSVNYDADAQIILDYGCDINKIPAMPSTVLVTPEVCTVAGETDPDTIAVKVTNTNDIYDQTYTYTVTVDGRSQTLTIADSAFDTVTFSGLTTGSHTVTVTGGDFAVPYTETVTLKACPTALKETTAVDGTFSDTCGLEFNLTFTPAVTEGVIYTQVTSGNTITVTAEAAEGYVLTNPDWVQTQTDQLEPCPLSVAPCTEVTGPTTVSSREQFADYYTDASTYTFTYNGLKLWINAADESVAWYHEVLVPLAQAGTQSMDYAVTSGIAPGMQLVIDANNDGAVDGILVGEPTAYGDNWWLTGDSSDLMKNGAPNVGGGQGSEWYGTLDEWLTQFPNAMIVAVGFNLSGIEGSSGILKSLTLGCQTWVFTVTPGQGGGTLPEQPPVTEEPTVPVTAPMTPLAAVTELPHTGPTDAGSVKGTFLALIAAVATYGAVYFARAKREY